MPIQEQFINWKIIAGKLKNYDISADGAESLFVLTILEKIKETQLEFSERRTLVL